MSCRSFAVSMPKSATLCLAIVVLCAQQAAMVAQENDGAVSREAAQSAEEVSEQPSDAVGNVTLPHSDDVPTKGESDALRRLREGKALVVGPSKSPTDSSAEQDKIKRQMLVYQRRQQELRNRQQALEAEHRQSVERLAQALRGGNAGGDAAREAVAQWQNQQAKIAASRREVETELRHLELETGNLAAMAAQLQQMATLRRERGPLPADATTRIYSLRNSQASAMARVLSEILDGKNIRMAVDERTNSLIVLGEQDTNNMVEALLLRLDEAAAGSTKHQSGETLQLRVVWLLDGMGEGKHPEQIAINPDVIQALQGLGFEDARVVCQQVTTLTLNEDGRGEFNFTVPVLIKSQPWDFEGHGQVESMAGERFNLKFDLGFQRMVAPTGGFGGRASRQGAQLGGSIYTPLGHYTVMGTTTFVATDLAPDDVGRQGARRVASPRRDSAGDEVSDEEGRQGAQQHLSAFVVYLDRAREFPAKSTEENRSAK